MSDVRIVPADQAPWEELRAVFGTRGPSSRCFCQRYKLARGEAFARFPAEERAERLCADPGGLLALVDDEPVGWVAVEPRAAYDGLVRNSSRAAWVGRDEGRLDPAAWAVTCVQVRF